MISNRNKKVCSTLNYIELFPTLFFAATGCISIPAFNYLGDNTTGIKSSTIGLNICATIAEVKKYESKINKKKERIMMKQYC